MGVQPLIIESDSLGAGASGNPAALVMPRLDAGGGEVAQLYAQAFARAVDVYGEHPDCVIASGALQLEAGPKDPTRFDRIAASGLFEADAVRRLDAGEASARLGEASPAGGLDFSEALVVEPLVVLNAWLAGVERLSDRVESLQREDGQWRLMNAAGTEIARAEVVCLAAGADTARLAPDAPLSAVRGQISVAQTSSAGVLDAAIWGGYIIPAREGLLFGATHDRADTSTAVLEADHRRNLEMLAQGRPKLAETIDAAALGGRASIRAVTPDFLPLAGAVEGAEGVFVLSGLGSRGFCAAPLLAEHIAALAMGAPSPLLKALQAIVDPGRFALRRNRKLRRLGVKSTPSA